MNHNALYSKWQFAVGRVMLGVYLAINWLSILLSNQSKLLTLNIAHLTVQTPKVSIVFVSTMIIFSIFFLLGIQRRIASICLWLGYLISGQMNIIIELLLFAMAFIPTGEAMSWRNIKGNLHWKLANSIFIGMWMMIGGLYFVLGYFAWKHEPLIQHYAASYIPYFWIIVYQIGVAILSIFKVSRLYA